MPIYCFHALQLCFHLLKGFFGHIIKTAHNYLLLNRKHDDTFADKKNNNAPVFAEALHLCKANIENSYIISCKGINFCEGLKAGIIMPVSFKETPIFQEAPRSFLKKLHGYNLQYAVL